MSGHSKWNNIKRKKEKTDGARAKVFTKIGREIAVAVKEGGGNPASNSKLAALIAKAKANSVPNDNIQRIIKRAEGGDKTEYEAITYEGYGPGGIAVMVETLTDNRNRTAANMRHYFDKFGGNLGQMGCVGFMFTQKGVIVVEHGLEFAFLQHFRAHSRASESDGVIFRDLIGGKFRSGHQLATAGTGYCFGHGLRMARAAPVDYCYSIHFLFLLIEIVCQAATVSRATSKPLP